MTIKSEIEPSKHIATHASLNAKKIRFEINEIELPMGVEGTFGVIKHPGAALAVPINKKGQVIILRQYRFAIERRILEFPAGTLEKDETPLITMKRELVEESGYIAKNWSPLGILSPCPGYSDELIHLFLARDLEIQKDRPKGDEDEDIEVLILEKEELNNLIASGEELLDGKSITAWYRTMQFLNYSK